MVIFTKHATDKFKKLGSHMKRKNEKISYEPEAAAEEPVFESTSESTTEPSSEPITEADTSVNP